MIRKLFFITTSVLLSSLHSQAGVSFNVPDKEGTNVKGVVYCGNEPVCGVQVSDGVNISVTDENGHYYIDSKKECGYIFICNPKGYKAKQEGKYPAFYKFLNTPNSITDTEQIDFELVENKNSNHTVLFLADIQMCNRNDDKSQFVNHAVPDINETIENYKRKGNDVYVITLGDQAYDAYWHKGFGIPEVKSYMDKLKPDAIYNCMGNHDNNPEIAGDWAASVTFREHWGPTYYSFNAGDIHYIVLDNIEYLNPEGNKDDRSFNCNIVSQITKWLRKDLANVSKETPLVICMHAPLFARPQCSAPDQPDPIRYRYDFGATFYNSVKDFKNVRVFTGHAHTNYTASKANITEYNVGAVCGNLWWTGYFTDGNSVCTDGTPAGYRVLESSGNNIMTYYKSIGYQRNYQFRSYDLNNCHITGERFAPSYNNPEDIETWIENGDLGFGNAYYNTDGTPKSPNKVLINVFAYDPLWKIEVFEDGMPLKVSRVSGHDPFSMISDGCQRFDKTGHNSSGNPTKNSHLFEVQANSAVSTLVINVTDEYGNVYTEHMERPKEFSINRYMTGKDISAIETILPEDENLQPEYYDMTGIRINNPGKGLYLMRKGSKTTKVFFRN